jgi:hypothetical protein
VAKRLPSLALISDIVRDERATQNLHFQALDTKAGVILGFSSALVALGGRGDRTLATIGQIVAVLAALIALWSFLRSYPVVDLRALREQYLGAEEPFTQLHVLDTEIEMTAQASDLLAHKARRLKWSMLGLVWAAGILAGAMIWR